MIRRHLVKVLSEQETKFKRNESWYSKRTQLVQFNDLKVTMETIEKIL